MPLALRPIPLNASAASQDTPSTLTVFRTVNPTSAATPMAPATSVHSDTLSWSFSSTLHVFNASAVASVAIPITPTPALPATKDFISTVPLAALVPLFVRCALVPPFASLVLLALLLSRQLLCPQAPFPQETVWVTWWCSLWDAWPALRPAQPASTRQQPACPARPTSSCLELFAKVNSPCRYRWHSIQLEMTTLSLTKTTTK